MILSPLAVQVLQNFQTINQSIHVKPGNSIKTLTDTGSIFAEAIVPDKFDKEFAIHDLGRFLGLLSLHKQSDIEWFEHHCVITQGTSRTKYAYCVPEVIKSGADSKMTGTPPVIETFELASDTLQSVLKAMNILGYDDIAIVAQDGQLSLNAINVKNMAGDTYSARIGETSKRFQAVIESDKFKLLNTNYTVHVSDGLCRFNAKFEDGSVDYWIAQSEKYSKFQ